MHLSCLTHQHALPFCCAWPDQAGLEGQQRLADSFLVARATGAEAPQAVYVNRELDLDVWQLADKVLHLGFRV